jgi:polyisoprenoid-binding protein YceI
MKTTYLIDPAHSTASFSVKHMMIAKVHGGFGKMKGSFTFDPQNPSNSKVEAVIETGSINTGDTQRDTHLKSAEFFDVEKFPTITYSSTQLEKQGEGMKILGNLTIHGVTKQVILDVDGPTSEVKDPWGNIKVGASGSARIKRKDFGLSWNAALEAGGVLVGDDVNITLDVQFVKQV